VKLVEALSFFCVDYKHGLKLPVGAGAFPEVVTARQRRTSVMLAVFLLRYYFATMSASAYLPQRWDHFQMPSTGDAEFPYNVDFADGHKCSDCVQHSCPEDTL